LGGLNEDDLLNIRQSLEKDSKIEALRALEITLERLGYKRMSRISQYDIYLSSREENPELDALIQLRDILKKKAEKGGN